MIFQLVMPAARFNFSYCLPKLTPKFELFQVDQICLKRIIVQSFFMGLQLIFQLPVIFVNIIFFRTEFSSTSNLNEEHDLTLRTDRNKQCFDTEGIHLLCTIHIVTHSVIRKLKMLKSAVTPCNVSLYAPYNKHITK